MNKTIKYARNGAIIGGAGWGLYNAIDQLFLRENNQKFNWQEFLVSILKGVGWGGSIGLGVGVVTDHMNKAERPINTDTALLSILNNIRLSPTDQHYCSLKQKSDWLITVIKTEFKADIKAAPHRFGSTEKGTALSDNYDIDILVPFRFDAFATIYDMFYCLYDKLKPYEGTNGIVEVRVQNKSIGVLFSINGKDGKVDIVPQKSTRGSRSAGFLYVKGNGIFDKPSRTKTDVQLQNTVKLNETQKRILVVLKDWKNKERLPVSSHLLQYLVSYAYNANKGHIPKRFTDKVVMVLEYIEDNIETLVLPSVENSNNILTDIPVDEKRVISRACKAILDEYEYQPNSIVNLVN